MRHLLTACTFAAYVAFCPAFAQAPVPAPSFEGQSTDTLWVIDGMLVPACDSAGRTYTRIEGGQIDYKLKGDRDTRDQGVRIYRETYSATGCGAAPRRLNIQIFYGGDGTKPIFVNLPPGQTAITAGVLADIMKQTVPMLIAIKHRSCATNPPAAGVPTFLVRDSTIVSGVPFSDGWSCPDWWCTSAGSSR